MIDTKGNFQGGLDLDDSYYVLPENSYANALNVTRNALEGSNDNVITNIIGTRIVPFTYPSGTRDCIGAYPYNLRNQVIFFMYNSNGYHGVYQLDNTLRIITKIFENLTDSGGVDILGFTKDGKITSVNIYARDEGDLLFFLDSLGRPTVMDIAKFIAGEYTPVTREIINVAKKPPLSPPQAVFDNDTGARSNYFSGKLCRFKTRWIYDSYEKSTWSPISFVPLPVSILDNTFTNLITNNNVIRLVANTGDKNVKSIEIAFSYVDKSNNWVDFQSVAVVNKSDLVLSCTYLVSPYTGGLLQAVLNLSGTPIVGAVITVKLTQIPSTIVTIGTYTVVLGDTLSSIAAALAANLATNGIAISPTSIGSQVFFTFYSGTYTFKEVDVNLTNGVIDNISFPYSFYNESTYPTVDVPESILLFDYTPDYANAQELANGNVLVYGGITEGYDKDTAKNSTITIGNVEAGNGGITGSLNAVLTATSDTSFHQIGRWDFSGIPPTGTVITVQGRLKSTHLITTVSTYTTVAGDTPSKIVYDLVNSAVTVIATSAINVQLEKSTYEPISGTTYTGVVITPPTSSLSSNSIATWLPSSQRRIGRAYFDINGKTNGILYSDKVVFPAYNEDGSHITMLPYINYKINDIPPSWAYSMQFYFTKENTQYLVWQSLSVNTDEADYIYFDITSLVTNAAKNPTTSQVLSYTFKDGDRVKIWKDVTTNTVLDYTFDTEVVGLVVDPTIATVAKTGTFLKIKKASPFAGIVNTDNYLLYIYTPSQQTSNTDNQVYYECGREYSILDPTLATRRHSGQVTDQVYGVTPAEYNFYEGDAYFRSRKIASAEGDAGVTLFNVFDRNFVDSYISAVSSIDGRPNIIDTNARKQYYSTLLRFGQAYQADTNINGLNRFYPADFDEYDYTFADIVRIKTRDRFLKIFQKFKIGRVPLYSQITKDPSGSEILMVSDKLINPISYRVGNLGLSAPESLASWEFADYGCDTSKGVVWRDSQDGTEPISRLYKIDSWAITELPLRTGNKKIYGAFYPIAHQYIMALEASICVPVVIPTITLPDGVVGVAYSYQTAITGSDPINIFSETIPTWMKIVVGDGLITFSGTPDATGSPSISFSVSNGCGSQSVNTSVTVANPPCVPVTISGDIAMPDATVGLPYAYSFYVAGSALFTVGTISPSWLAVTVTGNTITLRGTPTDSGTVTVDFTISNDCGSAPFSSSLNVGGARFTTTTYVSGDALNDVEIANLIGEPTAIATITLTTYTNSNGGTLKVNGVEVTGVGETWNVTFDSSGQANLSVVINGVTGVSTGIYGMFTLSSVTVGGIGTPNTYSISKAF